LALQRRHVALKTIDAIEQRPHLVGRCLGMNGSLHRPRHAGEQHEERGAGCERREGKQGSHGRSIASSVRAN
jgi:hypothetical protein